MDLPNAISRLIEFATSGQGRSVHLCNAYTLSLASSDPSYASVIDRGDLNLTDGMPLAWLARHLGFDVDPRRRPRGAELFTGTVVAGQDEGVRHYLYGGTTDVIGPLAAALSELAPRAQIVGAESPPFRPLEAHEKDELVARIHHSGAQIVWVGLGTPKQDHFVADFRNDLTATLVAVGAAFDFIAGAKKQAPRWVTRSGLEWLYRLVSEPRRLWRRYLIGNVKFIAGVIRTRTFVDA